MKNLIAKIVPFLALISPAMANDSVAEIGAGGIQFVYTGDIQMVREDLYISADEIRVDYIFRNISGTDITRLIAFPMPDITPDPFSDIGLPYEADNFLGFSVSVNGARVEPQLQQRASIVGVDVTSQLIKRGVPLFPSGARVLEALEMQPPGSLANLMQAGAVFVDTYDVGNGMVDHMSPAWTLHSIYYWEMDFPAGKDILVSHVYSPAVGATAGLSETFFEGEAITSDYAQRYCVDDGFVGAVHRKIAGGAQFFENWISYILVTGQNWYGNIGTFHLTVDKGSANNLVSFCGDGVTKTGPTTFELTIENYFPDRNLDILLLQDVGR